MKQKVQCQKFLHLFDCKRQHPLFGRLFTGFKNYNDVDELKKFPLWLKRYLEQETGEKIYKIDLYKVNVAFGQSGSVKKISSTLVHTIK